MNTEQADAAAPAVEATKHCTTIRAKDGSSVSLTRGAPLHALQISRSPGGAQLTAWLSDSDLARLLAIGGEPRCANCHYSRMNGNGELRCHLTPPRKRGDEIFFPRMADDEWCGRWKQRQPIVTVEG